MANIWATLCASYSNRTLVDLHSVRVTIIAFLTVSTSVLYNMWAECKRFVNLMIFHSELFPGELYVRHISRWNLVHEQSNNSHKIQPKETGTRHPSYTPCFKKSFTTSKEYIDLFRGHTQCFEVSECRKTHQVLPRIVMVRCDFHW
jgi:hypothetical protein